MTEIVTVDIGGTHARFAIASIAGDGAIALGESTTLRTEDHPTFAAAWEEFARAADRPLPRAAAFSIAAPVGGEVVHLVNNPWQIAKAELASGMGLDAFTVVNDFGAVGHAVARLGAEHFAHLSGPDRPLPPAGTITILGPGTGLGVAHLWRDGAGTYRVQATEGGHFSFAPIDEVDDALLLRLRGRFGRVSAERVVSGPAICDIYAVMAERQRLSAEILDDKTLWRRAIDGDDPLARAAAEHFCRQLGAVAGDLALAQGATGVVVAGGLGLRLWPLLTESGFGEWFRSKGRFSEIVAGYPVKLVTHPQPGLFGAAAAFATEHLP